MECPFRQYPWYRRFSDDLLGLRTRRRLKISVYSRSREGTAFVSQDRFPCVQNKFVWSCPNEIRLYPERHISSCGSSIACYTRCTPQYVILVPGYFRLFSSVKVCWHALQRNRWILTCHSIEDPANIGISLSFVRYLEYLCTFPTQSGQETDSDLRILRKFMTTGAVVAESIMLTHSKYQWQVGNRLEFSLNICPVFCIDKFSFRPHMLFWYPTQELL